VKQLAAQTAKATSEISSQITAMQSATQESVVAIKEIGGTIGRISEIATTIAAAIEEQGAATQEITRKVQQAASGTTQVAPTSARSIAARPRPASPPRRCSPRRSRSPTRAAGSSTRWASSSPRCVPPDGGAAGRRRIRRFAQALVACARICT
jgi:hypothetical protein